MIEISYCLIAFDRTNITAGYVSYIDLIIFNVLGNTTKNIGDAVPNEMYLFRNALMGANHAQFQLNGSQTSPNYYYYAVSSASDTFTVWRGFNHRIRSCPSNLSYFQPSTVLCYDSCPENSYEDTDVNLCLNCYYSCSNCSKENDSTACTACSSSSFR